MLIVYFVVLVVLDVDVGVTTTVPCGITTRVAGMQKLVGSDARVELV